MINTELISQFLDELFQDSGGYIEIRQFLKGKDNKKGDVRRSFFKTPDEVVAWLQKFDQRGWNTYYGVLPRKVKSGKKDAVIDYADRVWADLDFFHGEAYSEVPADELKRRALEEYDKINNLLAERGIPVYVAVFSGYGIQLLFRLSKEVPKEEIEELNEILIKFFDKEGYPSDSQVKDASRVFRLPGTINWRYENNPVPAEVIEINRDAVVDPETIRELVPVEETPSQTVVNSLPSPTNWVRLSEQQKEKIYELLKDFYRESQRQKIAFNIAGYLAKSGVHPEDAVDVVWLFVSRHNDREVRQRLEGIAWSYAKVSDGEEIFKAIYEKAKLYGFKEEDVRNWLNSGKGDFEKLKGAYPQLREVVKASLKASGLSEDEASSTAVEIITRLEDTVGKPVEHRVLGVPITINTAREYRISYINNPEKGIAKVKYPLNGWKVLEYNYITSFYIDSVKVLHDPSTGERKYSLTIHYPSKNETRSFPPLTIDELIELLKAQEGVRRSQSLRDSISSLIDAFESKGRAKVEISALSTGFVEIDGKLHFFNYEKAPVRLPAPNKEGLREALELLNEFAEKFHHADGFVAGLCFGVVQPLGFVKKQNHVRNLLLLLWGEPKTGKSTIGDIVLAIWGCPRTSPYAVSGDSIRSQARLGRYLNDTTLPIVIDEVRSVVNDPNVSDMLKNSRSELIARTIIEKGIMRTFYARASLILTTNYLPLITDPGLAESLAVFQFTAKQKPSKEERDEFGRWYSEIRPKLAYIGAYLKKIFIENWEILKPHILKEDFVDPGKRILKFLYVEAGLEPPEWIDKELIPSEIEEEIDELDLILGTLRYDLLEACRRVGLNVLAEELATWWDRIVQLNKIGALPEYLQLNKKGDRVYLNPALIEAVRRRTGYEIAGGLKNVAEKYGFKYHLTPDKNKRAIIFPLADFSKMLGDSLDESEDSVAENSDSEPEYQEWDLSEVLQP